MSFTVITNPAFKVQTGFTNHQFQKLDGLYCRAAAVKTLNYRTVECDFEAETASYTYYQSMHQAPFLQFIIRRVGPQTMMYELYKQGQGRIVKSGLFERSYERLKEEIEGLLP